MYGENAKMKIIDSDVFLKNNENLDSSNHYIIISNDKNKNNFYNQLNAKYFNFNKIFATFENSEVQDFESFPSFKKPKEIIIVKTLDKNKLKKTSTEIKLKEDLFKNKFIKTIVKDNLINKKYTLIYFNITKTDKTKYINAVTVNIELKKNGIKINEHFKYNLDTVNIFEFKNKLFSELITKECKDVFESVYDDSFYIVDEDNEEVFSCYNSSRIPRIIGDTNIDSIKDFKEHGKLSRTGIHGKSYLPFYLSQTTNGNNEFTYVEKFNNYNLFFTSINNNNAKITKETLIYKTYTIYKDGIKNNDNLESLFYSCFTIDSLKVNSISKKTILQKIAELYILN